MLRPFLRVVPNGSGQGSSGATGAAGSEATYNSRLACLKNAAAFALFHLEVPCGPWGSISARWRIIAATPRGRKRQAGAPPIHRCRTPDSRLERAPGQANANAVLANNRRCHHSGLLVPVGALPGLPMMSVPAGLRPVIALSAGIGLWSLERRCRLGAATTAHSAPQRTCYTRD